jgi:hypothetical protein
MIDRWGNPVRVAWAAHELLWIEAALSLDVRDRMAAFTDIAELTGRPRETVQRMAANLRSARKREAEALRQPVRMALPHPTPPSALRPPTLAQLMGGRATGRRPFLEAAE